MHLALFPFATPRPSESYTLSLHDALPISLGTFGTKYVDLGGITSPASATAMTCSTLVGLSSTAAAARSEEHTSELQSHSDLVCRLLLEKKNHQHGGQHFPEARRQAVEPGL